MTDFENQVLNQLYEQGKILDRIAEATETVRMLETDKIDND